MTFQPVTQSLPSVGQIYASVERHLAELGQVVPEFPAENCLPAMTLRDLLKETGRSGKQVRIEHFDLGLPVQSHLDHVRSLGAIADVISRDYSLSTSEIDFVSGAIGYHDLPEIVTRDEPAFTSPELKAHLPESLIALSRDEALDFIRQSFPEHLRARFDHSMNGIEQRDDLAVQLFQLSDKIEPITAVWRYLRCYRAQIDVRQFLKAMEDFFENPGVMNVCFDDSQREAVRFLQSKEHAESYFSQGSTAFEPGNPDSLVRRLIAGVIDRFDIESV